MSSELQIYLILGISAFVAGAMNAVAGGGTLLTFPALLLVVSPEAANATSTVALVPGSMAGAWGFRREMRQVDRWNWILVLPSVVGGAIGSFLVIRFPQSFAGLVPWLILAATLLFLIQPSISALVGIGSEHAAPGKLAIAGVIIGQFLVAVYGGYFGAGIGILMLSALALMGMDDLHRMNAVKTLLASCINLVAVGVFIYSGQVQWKYAPTMALASIVGGYLGAHWSRWLNKQVLRWIVIAIGLILSFAMFWKQLS